MNAQCESIQHLFIDYFLGKLDESDANAVEEHVSSCPTCSEVLGDVKPIVSALSRQPMVEPSAEVCRSIKEAARAGALRRRPLFSAIKDFAAAFMRRPLLAGSSAFVAVVVVAILLMAPPPPSRTGSRKPGRSENISWDTRGKVIKDFRSYLLKSQELLRSAEGANIRSVLSGPSRDDWKQLVGQAMNIREQTRSQSHRAILRDLEILYREIMSRDGSFEEDDLRQIDRFINRRHILQRIEGILGPADD